MTIRCFGSVSAMMEQELTQTFSQKEGAPGIGDWLEWKNAQNVLAADWTCGASPELARRWNCEFRDTLHIHFSPLARFWGSSEERRARMLTSVPSPIRILCVDDHAIVREGIVALLGSQIDMQVVAQAGSGFEALEEFRRHQPDVTLMDLRMPEMSGIDVMTAILQEFPNARFIILTTYGGDVEIVRALRAGAQAYILKGHLRKELFDTIHAVHEGRRRIPPEIASQIASHTADSTLSAREVDVLQLIAAGNANKLIADKLSISEDTVKGHVKSILYKLGAHDRTHAVTISIRRGIIEL